ncbi:MAG: hypothetical protein AVDCRST_MAG88-592, partial [uncultured Thermomicrobiales bacterium]
WPAPWPHPAHWALPSARQWAGSSRPTRPTTVVPPPPGARRMTACASACASRSPTSTTSSATRRTKPSSAAPWRRRASVGCARSTPAPSISSSRTSVDGRRCATVCTSATPPATPTGSRAIKTSTRTTAWTSGSIRRPSSRPCDAKTRQTSRSSRGGCCTSARATWCPRSPRCVRSMPTARAITCGPYCASAPSSPAGSGTSMVPWGKARHGGSAARRRVS